MSDNKLTLEIDTETLTLGALMELEEATTARAISRWLVDHAGVTLDEVRALPVAQIKSVAEQIKEALAPGK